MQNRDGSKVLFDGLGGCGSRRTDVLGDAARWLGAFPCCLMVGGDRSLSARENVRRSRRLAAAIRASNLTHGVCDAAADAASIGRFGMTAYLVVNNRYTDQAFRSLCLSWCRAYNGSSMLVTKPCRHPGSSGIAAATTYDQFGKATFVQERPEAPAAIEAHLAAACGEPYRLASIACAFESPERDVRTRSSRLLSEWEFFDLYPDLSAYDGTA